MGLPVVTCGSNEVLDYNAGSQTAYLTATATEGADTYVWTLLSVPTGSTALTETRGSFVNGTASVQNPSFDTDPAIEGAYVFQCVATGSTGTSSPDTDKETAQQIVVVKTQRFGMTFANDFQWSWGDYISNSLTTLEDAIGTVAPISHNHVKADVTDFTHTHVAGDITGITLIDTGDSRLSDSRAPSGSASGDLGGTYPSPTVEYVTASGIQLALDSISDGQFLKRVGTDIVGAAAEGGGGSSEHALGSATHTADTLANLNAKLSDATLIDTADSRLSDSRTPTSHASSHASGQSDAIKLDDLAAPDDNTDLDATTSAHGLLPKLGGGTTNFLRADGTWAAPAGGGSVVIDAPPYWNNVHTNESLSHIIGDFTVGLQFHVSRSSTVLGGKFTWDAAGSFNIKVTLWRTKIGGSTTSLATKTIAVTTIGVKEATFDTPVVIPADETGEEYRYTLGVYETGGAQVMAESSSTPFQDTYLHPDISVYYYNRPKYYAAGDAIPTSVSASQTFPIDPIVQTTL